MVRRRTARGVKVDEGESGLFRFITYFLAALFVILAAKLGFPDDVARNEWLKRPTPEYLQDNTSQIKLGRDAFFDKIIGSPSPLTAESAAGFHLSEGSYFSPNGDETRPQSVCCAELYD
jgi:hypothetical protein